MCKKKMCIPTKVEWLPRLVCYNCEFYSHWGNITAWVGLTGENIFALCQIEPRRYANQTLFVKRYNSLDYCIVTSFAIVVMCASLS